MIVTVTTLTGQMFPVEVAEDLELENFKAICEAESGYPATEMAILVTLFPKPFCNYSSRTATCSILSFCLKLEAFEA